MQIESRLTMKLSENLKFKSFIFLFDRQLRDNNWSVHLIFGLLLLLKEQLKLTGRAGGRILPLVYFRQNFGTKLIALNGLNVLRVSPSLYSQELSALEENMRGSPSSLIFICANANN